MKRWEIALEKFIRKWKNRKEVIGALVCGSYITGNPSRHSDVDILILLDSKTSWYERGNEIIDGTLIEYFARPLKRHYEELENDYISKRRVDAHMYTTGRVLFDKEGELKKIIKDSKKYMIKKYKKQSKIVTEKSKYYLWDICDNLEEVFEAKSKDFFFVYYVHLYYLFREYAAFLNSDSLPVCKIKRFLTNKEDKKKYHMDNFQDQQFVKMYIKALNIKDEGKMMEKYKTLTNYVLGKMGGFNINGWKTRSMLIS